MIDKSKHCAVQSGASDDPEETSKLLLKYDEKGLITAVVTDWQTGLLLMVAHMNETALKLTLETNIAHYWSRSRQTIWKKGETSGNFQQIKQIFIDCDQDALWLKVHVEGDGFTCHTGRKSCFYRRVVAEGDNIKLITDAD